MSRLRAITVALVALAVAALPVAGVGVSTAHADCAKASAASHAQHEMDSGHHAGMDHAGQAMADHGQGHDGQDGAGPCDHSMCGGKCLCIALTAVLPAAMNESALRLPRPATVRVAAHLGGPAYVPPSPPPRV